MKTLTSEEIDGLVLFKEYTHLQLKMFQVALSEERAKGGASGGGGDQYEDRVLNHALDFHRLYVGQKLRSDSISFSKFKQGKLGL